MSAAFEDIRVDRVKAALTDPAALAAFESLMESLDGAMEVAVGAERAAFQDGKPKRRKKAATTAEKRARSTTSFKAPVGDQVTPIEVRDADATMIFRLRPDGVIELPTDQPEEAARLFVDDVYRMWRNVLPAPELRLADALSDVERERDRERARADALESNLRQTRNLHDWRAKDLREMQEALALERARADAYAKTIERIWKQVAPGASYEDLDGRSIYDFVDELVRERARADRAEAALAESRDSLTMLRGAWNAHFETCPEVVLEASDDSMMERIAGWMNAPSNTASAHLSSDDALKLANLERLVLMSVTPLDHECRGKCPDEDKVDSRDPDCLACYAEDISR